MSLKLRQRLLKRFALIATVSIVLTAFFSTAAYWLVFSSQENTNLIICAQTTVNAYNVDKNSIKSNGYESDILRLTLISSEGEVLYDSEPDIDESSLNNHSDRPEFVAAIKDGEGESRRISSTLGKTTYYYAIKANDGNVVRVSCTIENFMQVFLRLMPSFGFIICIVFFICLTMSKRSTIRIVTPIQRMYENPDEVPYEELAPLADTIKRQQKEIRSQLRNIQMEKDKINTLIQNMSEGFILIDMDKKVLMSNPSASKLIGAEGNDIEGTSLYAYTRNEIVTECVDSALSGEGKTGDILVNGRVLQLITNPVYSNKKQNGVICLIIDVSEKKKAEKMRREFTANVTHELKTPLTSISGYAEMIASGLAEPDDVQGFAKKIHKESGRLLTLIGDIMELSRLDERSSDESVAPVNLASIAKEVAEDLRANADKHNVSINVDTKKVVLNGNRNQLYELVYNLCDNAIRYNREGGQVRITVDSDDNGKYIRVFDTGIGIPEKHQSRIFERFYRVDKSRSKERGGTGLGLAIVKHIAERHSGTVTVESNINGTTFIVKF